MEPAHRRHEPDRAADIRQGGPQIGPGPHHPKAALALRAGGIPLVDPLWSFVGGTPIQNGWQGMGEIPAETAESAAMSRDLRRRGFRFVGPTICYALMQSIGLVNDHTVECYR